MLGNKNKSAIKVSVKKSTDSLSVPSKEKHVKAILLRTFSRDDSIEQIVKYLTMRLDKSNWVIVLKTLMIFHRCFRDGDQAFMDYIKPKSQMIFALNRFLATSPSTQLYTVFVKKYAKYLEEKVSVVRLLNYQFEKNQDSIKNLKSPQCFKTLSKLQSQLNALLNCKMRAQHVGQNTLIHRTYVLLMKDSLLLYQLLNEGIIQLLDMFWKMSKKSASKVIGIYKLFVKETDALIGLYEIGNRFLTQLPQIKKAETSIIDSLEKHIDKLPNDEESEEESDEKKSKKHTKGKRKGNSDESDEDLKEDEEEFDDYDHKDKKEDDSEGSQNDESDGEDDEEPEDLMNLFSGLPAQQQAFFSFAPTLGLGGAPLSNNLQPNYNDKASPFNIKPLSTDPAFNLYNPNQSILSSNNNTFSSQPLSNPFQLTGPQANPFAQGANPFSSNSNPFGGGSNFSLTGNTLTPAITGSSSGYASMSKPNLMNPTSLNPAITGSSSGYNTSLTGTNPFASAGLTNNNFGAAPTPFGNASSNNIFGGSFNSAPPSSSISLTGNLISATASPFVGSTSQPQYSGSLTGGVGFNPNPTQNPFAVPRNTTSTNPFL